MRETLSPELVDQLLTSQIIREKSRLLISKWLRETASSRIMIPAMVLSSRKPAVQGTLDSCTGKLAPFNKIS